MRNKIYFTGDTHGWYGDHCLEGRLKRLPEDAEKLIILGDFGVLWDSRFMGSNIAAIQKNKPAEVEILFVAGNHENYDIIKKLPQEEKFDSEVGVVGHKIYHLKTGNFYNINGQNYAVFGGGLSIDKHLRREGISWWKDEIPSVLEMDNFYDKLSKANTEDMVLLTHVPSLTGVQYYSEFFKLPTAKKRDAVSSFVRVLKNTYNFKAHLHGHMHEEYNYYEPNITHCLYTNFLKLNDLEGIDE